MTKTDTPENEKIQKIRSLLDPNAPVGTIKDLVNLGLDNLSKTGIQPIKKEFLFF